MRAATNLAGVRRTTSLPLIPLTRRQTLGLLASTIPLASAAACTASPPASSDPSTGPSRGIPDSSTRASSPAAAPTSSTASVTPSPTPSVTPTPSPGAGAFPGRAAIVERYAGQVPTEWGLEPTGIVRSLGTTDKVVALTFDLCGGLTPTSGGNGYDADLVALLRRHQAHATFFVNLRWAKANPALMDGLIADPLFEIGNHGTAHLPLSVSGRKGYTEQGTHDAGEVYDEVEGNTEFLTRLTGSRPKWFRSGTAHYDEIAVKIVKDLGQRCIGFTVNGDAGTTFTAAQVVSAVRTSKAGDIVISHANRPPAQTAEGYAVALPALLARGLRPVRLSDYLKS